MLPPLLHRGKAEAAVARKTDDVQGVVRPSECHIAIGVIAMQLPARQLLALLGRGVVRLLPVLGAVLLVKFPRMYAAYAVSIAELSGNSKYQAQTRSTHLEHPTPGGQHCFIRRSILRPSRRQL